MARVEPRASWQHGALVRQRLRLASSGVGHPQKGLQMIKSYRWLWVAIVLTCSSMVLAQDQSMSAAGRYTFSWSLHGEGALQPRGGSTKGAPVVLDEEPSAAWRALQSTELSPFERDRRAILAMAGTYRVTFDFLEIEQFLVPRKLQAPYQSWGTEKIYVDVDDTEFISLVHILEMRILLEDGSLSEPMVTKHWRQDWQFEPKQINVYTGNHRWMRSKVASKRAAGAWAQTVYQVDESPRYASVGHWSHNRSFSSWHSDETWRPLPRREWSVRDDYGVLIGTNRHTISSTGWLQEENNLKAVLASNGSIDRSRPYLAREYGVARYERIRAQDFAAADKYYARTKAFWDQVRERWRRVFATQRSVSLRGPVDKLGLFRPLFARADAIAEEQIDTHGSDERVIEEALEAMGALEKKPQ
jgi:hypothetical protein